MHVFHRRYLLWGMKYIFPSWSVSSPLRRVPQFFSGSTGVLSGKYRSPFRRGLGKFPYACPGISPGMARDVRKQTEKKFMLYPADWYLLIGLSLKFPEKKCWKCLEVMFYSTTFAPAFERESDTDGEKVWQFRKTPYLCGHVPRGSDKRRDLWENFHTD